MLIKRLSSWFGIGGLVLDWFKSYLCDHYQCQFEHMRHKDKSQLSRGRLCRQIAWCNKIINRDKAECYSTDKSDNSHDPRRLWQTLQHVLHKDHKIILLPHHKSLANQFGSFFNQRIKRIYDMFSASSSTVIPLMCPPLKLPHCNW